MIRPEARRLKYAMVIESCKDARGRYFSAFFPDLPGCATMGRTLAQLREHAKEAIALYLWGLERSGQPVPAPSARVDFVEAPQRLPPGKPASRTHAPTKRAASR